MILIRPVFRILQNLFVIFHRILMKLGMNDMRARGYRVTLHILYICINGTIIISSNGPTIHSQGYFS